MGQPAARTLDQSAHGGVIMGPGCPTVMIGGMPAVRVSDMHVCPMLNPGVPPPPHVGANIAKGSATVFIGGMPAVPTDWLQPSKHRLKAIGSKFSGCMIPTKISAPMKSKVKRKGDTHQLSSTLLSE